MLDILNDDVLIYLFAMIKPDPSYFRISKKIYDISHYYLQMHMNILNIKLPIYREYKTQCLFHYYSENLNKDIGHYRKYIINFISNKNRKTTIYPCVNNYHRMLVHQFCDVQGLLHETIIQGMKKVRCCKNCKSTNISFDHDEYDEYDEYYFHCKNCKSSYSGYLGYQYLDYTPMGQKWIKITKLNI